MSYTITMPTVDLASYDWIVINSSAGKDSQATLVEIVRRCEALDIPRSRIVVAHADLGRMEWKGTKALAETQAKVFGLRFEAIKRPQGDLLSHIETRGKWPGSQTRYCTSDHKRGQIDKLLTMLGRETRKLRKGPARILNCLGIRAEESHARAKKLPYERNARATGKGKAKIVDTYYPVFDWTTVQVWDVIKTSHPRVPYHFAYDLGMPRLSCIFCVFAPKSALLIAGKHNPELLAEYVRVERKIGHTFRDGFRIEEVQEALAAGATDAGALGKEDIVTWDM
jgi:3'-phosphoadenosine 5'-phosphosulfate sulfotransferase (PAPS reductase)/FAD synthetase